MSENDRAIDDLPLKFLDNYISAYCELFEAIENENAGDLQPSFFSSARNQIPWLNDQPLAVFYLQSALIFFDQSNVPKGHWYLDGGPAIKVDEVHTRTPLSVRTAYGSKSSNQKPKGIARAVLADRVPTRVWVSNPLAGASLGQATTETGKQLTYFAYENDFQSFLTDATFGFFGYIETLPIIPEIYTATAFEIVTNLGFFPADLNNARFFCSLNIVSRPKYFLDNHETRLDSLKAAIYRDLSRTMARQRFSAEDYIRQFSSKTFWDPSPNSKKDNLYDPVFSTLNLTATGNITKRGC